MVCLQRYFPKPWPFERLDEKIEYLGALAVKLYEALGSNRYRLDGRASYGNGEPIEVTSRTDIIVNSHTSFTTTSNDAWGVPIPDRATALPRKYPARFVSYSKGENICSRQRADGYG